MRLKAKDIAEKIGVSTAAVSLVINNKPGVGEAKRKEILDKIVEMGCEYLLKDTKIDKGTIGFVVYKCQGEVIDEFPFFSYLIENININIVSCNYTMNIIYLDGTKTIEEQLEVLAHSNCKGFIVYAVEMFSEHLRVFKEQQVPCVFLDNSFPGEQIDAVSIDNHLGVRQALRFLTEMGHMRIGYIQSRVPIQSFDDRYEAFVKEIKKAGLSLNPADVLTVGYSESETASDVVRQMRELPEYPTAFFADNDLLACRAVQAIKSIGLRVPEDISMIGFDNRPICDFSEPPMTTIQVARDDMGAKAVDILLEKMESSAETCYKVLVGTEILERKSVKRIPTK